MIHLASWKPVRAALAATPASRDLARPCAAVWCSLAFVRSTLPRARDGSVVSGTFVGSLQLRRALGSNAKGALCSRVRIVDQRRQTGAAGR